MKNNRDDVVLFLDELRSFSLLLAQDSSVLERLEDSKVVSQMEDWRKGVVVRQAGMFASIQSQMKADAAEVGRFITALQDGWAPYHEKASVFIFDIGETLKRLPKKVQASFNQAATESFRTCLEFNDNLDAAGDKLLADKFGSSYQRAKQMIAGAIAVGLKGVGIGGNVVTSVFSSLGTVISEVFSSVDILFNDLLAIPMLGKLPWKVNKEERQLANAKLTDILDVVTDLAMVSSLAYDLVVVPLLEGFSAMKRSALEFVKNVGQDALLDVTYKEMMESFGKYLLEDPEAYVSRSTNVFSLFIDPQVGVFSFAFYFFYRLGMIKRDFTEPEEALLLEQEYIVKLAKLRVVRTRSAFLDHVVAKMPPQLRQTSLANIKDVKEFYDRQLELIEAEQAAQVLFNSFKWKGHLSDQELAQYTQMLTNIDKLVKGLDSKYSISYEDEFKKEAKNNLKKIQQIQENFDKIEHYRQNIDRRKHED